MVSCTLTTCSWSVSSRFRRALSNRKYGSKIPRFHMPPHPEMDIEKAFYSLSTPVDVDQERELHVYLFT